MDNCPPWDQNGLKILIFGFQVNRKRPKYVKIAHFSSILITAKSCVLGSSYIVKWAKADLTISTKATMKPRVYGFTRYLDVWMSETPNIWDLRGCKICSPQNMSIFVSFWILTIKIWSKMEVFWSPRFWQCSQILQFRVFSDPQIPIFVRVLYLSFKI